MSEKKRETFLDRLRVAATCAVVLLHTVTGSMDTTDMSAYPSERRVFLAVLDLVCWCVPVFVLISGYLFLNPQREVTLRQMLTKYCRRVFLALFFFGVPYAWLEQAAVERCFRLEMLPKGFLMVLRGESWSHLWYLYMILLLYLLTPAVRWLLKKLPIPAVYALLFALLLGGSILPFAKKQFGLEGMAALPDDCIYFFYYICGYLFALRGRETRGISAQAAADADTGRTGAFARCFRLLPVLALLLAGGMAVSRLGFGYEVQMAYNYPFTVLLALLLFGWGTTMREGDAAKWRRAGALCFAVYLVHPLFLNVYYKFLGLSPLDFSLWVSLPFFFLAALLPAAVTAWLLRKVPPLRKYVL